MAPQTRSNPLCARQNYLKAYTWKNVKERLDTLVEEFSDKTMDEKS
ncbi:MAG: hypothetical protein ACLFUS_12595 [Candidatus Sumerlaeia bacterium]